MKENSINNFDILKFIVSVRVGCCDYLSGAATT